MVAHESLHQHFVVGWVKCIPTIKYIGISVTYWNHNIFDGSAFMPARWSNGVLEYWIVRIEYWCWKFTIVNSQYSIVIQLNPSLHYSISLWPRPGLQSMRIKTLLPECCKDHSMFQQCRARVGQYSNRGEAPDLDLLQVLGDNLRPGEVICQLNLAGRLAVISVISVNAVRNFLKVNFLRIKSELQTSLLYCP